jgi:hypothetical protein
LTGEPKGPAAASKVDVFNDDLDGFDWGQFDMHCQTVDDSIILPPADQVGTPPPHRHTQDSTLMNAIYSC